MVIDDSIVLEVAESLMMVRLAIHQESFGESLGIDLLEFDQRDLEKPHHGDIVKSDDVVEVGDGN
jgi:pyoverdine/dityrosine biosynthesis protein Dit1